MLADDDLNVTATTTVTVDSRDKTAHASTSSTTDTDVEQTRTTTSEKTGSRPTMTSESRHRSGREESSSSDDCDDGVWCSSADDGSTTATNGDCAMSSSAKTDVIEPVNGSASSTPDKTNRGRTESREMAEVKRSACDDVEVRATMSSAADAPEGEATAADRRIVVVEFNKCSTTGVGFSIEGGKQSLDGNKPITVKRLFSGK